MNGRIILVLLMFWSCSQVIGQILPEQRVNNKNEDSSFYSICQINNNEFWIGGENGVLFRADSTGVISRSNLNMEGCTILKIVKQNPFVFLITDSQVVFRYHIPTSTLQKFTLPGFEKKCFYDITVLPQGKVILCGGNKQVARVKKCIPRGFILETDTGFHAVKTIWKNTRKFVWSLSADDNFVYASAFNGINSKIMQYKPGEKWKPFNKIKGIAYRIYKTNSGISAIGAASLKFKKRGIICNADKSKILLQSGCIWNRRMHDESQYFVSNNGDLIRHDKTKNTIEKTTLLRGMPFYDLEKINSKKWMIVGHGKTILFRDMN